MGIPRLFKLPKHKQFDYQPVYYDPEREKREERKKRIARESGSEENKEPRNRLVRGSMKEYFRRDRKAQRASNYRLILIAAVLFFIAYLLLFH